MWVQAKMAGNYREKNNRANGKIIIGSNRRKFSWHEEKVSLQIKTHIQSYCNGKSAFENNVMNYSTETTR